MPTKLEVWNQTAPLLQRLLDNHRARIAADETTRATTAEAPAPAVVARAGRGDSERRSA